MKKIIFASLTTALLHAAPAWKAQVHWENGVWTLASAQKIEADIKKPRAIASEAENFEGYCLEHLNQNGEVIYIKSLGEPGQIHAQFGQEHIEVQSPTQDLFFVLLLDSENDQIRIVKKTAQKPSSNSQNTPPASTQVLAQFKLGGQ